MAARRKHELDIDGRKVAVTNLDKPMYPSGFTKGQVIDFYIRVSDWLLPHLKGRPVTLKRYPNGVEAKHFYEKDAPAYTPDWVRTFPTPRRGGGTDIRYVIIDGLPELVWSANLANLEIHPFLHRVPEIQRPTSVVFDLDPGEQAGILNCGEIAFLLRKALEKRGMETFVKVSGSKGMQVYSPLKKRATYAETQPLARGLAEQLEREHPNQVVSAMKKVLRKGKVFIDWSQNSDFKTTVCVYSLRAKRAKPYVSMPITWEELRKAMKKGDPAALDFEPEPALERLKNRGDLFAPMAVESRLTA